MATYRPYLNPSIKRDGTHTVLLRITKNRKHASISLEFSIRNNQWNSSSKLGKYVRTDHPLHDELNKKIQREITELQRLDLVNRPASAFELKQLKNSSKPSQEDFCNYADEYLERVQLSKSIATYRKRKSTISRLKEFCKHKPLPFNQLTVSFIMDFEKYLYSLGNATGDFA